MRRNILGILGALALVLASNAHAAQTWIEGKHYARLAPVQRTTVPAGKVEVLEVFSYGCPACNRFQPVVERLRKSLPSTAQMAFLPASFSESEDWPMFQQAYFAAQTLGIADRTHQAVYDAIWKNGELAIVDPATGRLKAKKQLPTIQDAAKCYGRLAGVKQDAFLAAANSFGVNVKIRAADAQVHAMQVPSTPCIVVNGKYRVDMDSMTSADDIISVVNFLVAKETAR
jgi:protein dithiol oxidoreductase (disulfide-forming)